MTKGQIKTVKRLFRALDLFLSRVQMQNHVEHKDVVEEIRLNIQGEIDRLLAWEITE